MAGAKFVFRPGEGLFAQDVRWTARAKQMLDDDEYRYQSATFLYHPETGDVLAIVGAALTNRPALDGLTSAQLAALSAQLARQFLPHLRDDMNPLLKALLEGLGLPETATTEQGVSALATLKSQAAQAGQIAGLTAQIATLKAATPDPTKFVTVEAVAALNTELATLRAQNAQVEIDQVLNQAKADGKVASDVVEKTWRDIGKADLAQLKALVDATPANPVLAGKRQTEGKEPGKDAAELSQSELAVCAAMGLTLSSSRPASRPRAWPTADRRFPKFLTFRTLP